MSEMIERVVKAMAEADIDWYSARFPTVAVKTIRKTVEDDLQESYSLMARAAIQAIREPTPIQVEAALKALSDVTVADPKAAAWDALRAYRAMIDAALAGGEPKM